MKQRVALFFALSALLFSCKPEEDSVPGTTAYTYGPMPFTAPITPQTNQTQAEGVELGRIYLYEKKLSADNSISCGTCHQQKFAFSDGGKTFSEGVGGKLGGRNSMAIVNLAWEKNFMWNGVAKSLEEQAHLPIENPVEMHQDLNRSVNKLQNTSMYPPLFLKAFGSKEITEENVLKAIAQFERTLVSANSRYDQEMKNQYTVFTTDEREGLKLFGQHPNANEVLDPLSIRRGGNCGDCHTVGHFTNRAFMNNGLDATLTDLGLGEVTKNATDNGKFKVPTLRNIALTAPYMHDGRFKTLEEVLDHYNDHVQKNSPNLDPNMAATNNFGSNQKLGLTPDEKRKIIAFLNTLTDESFVTNPAFSDPFANK